MNESSILLPLFDLDFQLLTYNLQLQKSQQGSGESSRFSEPLTLPRSLNIISIIRHHK